MSATSHELLEAGARNIMQDGAGEFVELSWKPVGDGSPALTVVGGGPPENGCSELLDDDAQQLTRTVSTWLRPRGLIGIIWTRAVLASFDFARAARLTLTVVWHVFVCAFVEERHMPHTRKYQTYSQIVCSYGQILLIQQAKRQIPVCRACCSRDE